MIRSLLLVGLLFAATPALAEETVPDQGTLGIGAFISGIPVGGANLVQISPGLNATFWATDKLTISAILGVNTVENGPTNFTIVGGAAYYIVKEPVGHYGAFVGGNFGVNVASQNGNSQTSILLQLGGGGEYFVSRHMGVIVSEGLQFSTNPTTFALVTQLGARVYF